MNFSEFIYCYSYTGICELWKLLSCNQILSLQIGYIFFSISYKTFKEYYNLVCTFWCIKYSKYFCLNFWDFFVYQISTSVPSHHHFSSYLSNLLEKSDGMLYSIKHIVFIHLLITWCFSWGISTDNLSPLTWCIFLCSEIKMTTY